MVTPKLDPTNSYRFYFNHKDIDRILRIEYGSSILILDETFSEGRLFLQALLQNYITWVGSYGIRPKEDNQLIRQKSLLDISLELNDFRACFNRAVIVHEYLPEFVVRDGSKEVLRLIGSWKEKISNNRTVEFFILPKSTFLDIEKKLIAMMDGAIILNVKHDEDSIKTTFTPVRCCDPRYHLKEFSYMINEAGIAIQNLNQKIPMLKDQSRTLERVRFYKDCSHDLIIGLGEKGSELLDADDILFISQILGRSIGSLENLFPESFHEVLHRIVALEEENILTVSEKLQTDHEAKELSSRSRSDWMAKLALAMPVTLVGAELAYRKRGSKRVDADVYLAERRAVRSLLASLTRDSKEGRVQFENQLHTLEKRFGELSGRIGVLTALEKMNIDIAGLQVDMKHFEKIVKLIFKVAFDLDISIIKTHDGYYIVRVPECYLCRDESSTRPVCTQIEGHIEGVCSSLFKKKITCEEITCKAAGHNQCTFILRIDTDHKTPLEPDLQP